MISLPAPQFTDEATAFAESRKINLVFILVTSNGDDMNTLKDYLAQGVIKAHVSNAFAFEEMAQAHLQLESGRTVGRVVVKM